MFHEFRTHVQNYELFLFYANLFSLFLLIIVHLLAIMLQ